MVSAPTTGLVVGKPTNIAHLIGQKLNSQNEPSIVFLISGDLSQQELLKSIIGSLGWQLETFQSAGEFLARPRPLVPHCLILNISLTDLSVLDLQNRIASERTETPIVFIASHGDVRTTVQAMKAGAVEFLIKPVDGKALLSALHEAMERSRAALDFEVEMLKLRNCYASLSRRERQVMTLVVSGLLNKQVGGELGISEITVKAHRAQVMQKMRADSFAELVVMATRLRPGYFRNTPGRLSAPVHSGVIS
jgi:FixJ family two-component response regulator